MNPAGTVLLVGAVWIVCQVWGGDALGRLKVLD